MGDVSTEDELIRLRRCLVVEVEGRRAAEARVVEILKELTKINYALEHKVEERTREASEARDVALVASQTKSEFLATMSHEIRTPMNAIIGFAELLLKEPLDDRQHRFVERIDTSGKALLQIINDILDYSKIEAGKLEIDSVQFSLFDLMDQVHGMFSRQTENTDVDLVYEIDSDLPKLMQGDPLRIGQIITNLISNGLKFTESGSIKITARMQSRVDDRAVVEICCADTGIGIPDNVQKKLFSSFTQADSSTTRKYGGTGLGLSICKSLSEMMGGSIWLMSRVGIGSSFFFTVNLKVLTAADIVEEKALGLSLDDMSFPDAKILLVEDNEINQELAKEMLGDVDIIPDVAFNGLEAVEKVKLKDYDLVFMDIQMPLMDGLQATKRIREDFSKDELTIVAMTANASKEDRENCMSVGMNDFISKPIDYRTLIELIHYRLEAEGASMEIEPEVSLIGAGEGVSKVSTIDAEKAAVAPKGLKPPAEYTELDFHKALGMLGGKEALLEKMLTMFADKYSSADLQLSELIVSESWVDAQRFAHTIKGISANIAADNLAAISQILENELRDRAQNPGNIKNLDDYLLQFSDALKKLLADISH
ncbi:MAG: hypothetical protein COA99_00645 [Moraxellaceae bacterium]|nr:MAG: hypothetical protein COA99_00645 [Moraxellaceae bacterium]